MKVISMALSRTARCLFFGREVTKPFLAVISVRDFSASTETKPVRISKNLSFRPAHDSHLDTQKRPIVLVYGWLVAKAKHIHKYGDFYLGKGFDVLHIKVDPLQLLWPSRAQQVVGQIADFITEGPRRTQPILIHGFSVGGYLYGETLVKFTSDPARFGDMTRRVQGQIFDSPVDFEGVPRGVGLAVTPIPILQKTIRFTLETYLRVFHRLVTRYYIRSSAMFHSNPLRCPSLMFYSKKDVIGTPGPIEEVIKSWKKTGAPVYSKCWEDTPHVGHFVQHPVQYINAVNDFLHSIGLQTASSSTSSTETNNKTSPKTVAVSK